MKTMASQLPSSAVCYASRVQAIHKNHMGETSLELEDGTRLATKVGVIQHDDKHRKDLV